MMHKMDVCGNIDGPVVLFLGESLAKFRYMLESYLLPFTLQ